MRRLLPVPLLLLLLAGCAASSAVDPAEQPHGYVEGADELPEPQLRLAYLDADGAVGMLDPVTEEAEELATVPDALAIETDGRFLFVISDGSVEIIDAGVWTVDHGDHVHYYEAPAREVGSIEGHGIPEVRSDPASTVVRFPDGATTVLDREALGDGSLDELATIETDAVPGSAIPVGDTLVLAAGERAELVALDGERRELPLCTAPDGDARTSVGVILGCDEGALVVTEEGTDLVPYPAELGMRVDAFSLRPGRPVAAALAGSSTVALLDSRKLEWATVESPVPLTQIVAADDVDGHLVGIGEDGRAVVLREDGTHVGTSEPLELGDDIRLEVDAARAYVNSSVSASIVELDYRDAARVARVLPVPVVPVSFAEVGR